MTTLGQPNPMFAHTKHSEAGSMRVFTTEATPLSDPIVSAARWNWRKRRPYFRLRNFARVVASGMIDVRSGLLKALHDCADDAGLEARQTEPTEQ